MGMAQESGELCPHNSSKREELASKQLDVSGAVSLIYIFLKKEFHTATFCGNLERKWALTCSLILCAETQSRREKGDISRRLREAFDYSAPSGNGPENRIFL
jgi:hypothetical protein